MLTIPSSFWKEEFRCDFYISEVMKKAWAVQLTLLDSILDIASKHNIQVWMEFGSLIGAVRHNGYVPWDDDLDISVMRKDYLPLINYLCEEMPSHVLIENYYVSKVYNHPKTVISNRHHLDIDNSPVESEITARYFNFPCSGWIDLHPLDYIPVDRSRWGTILALYTIAYTLALDIDYYIDTGEFESLLSQLEKFTGIKVKRDENIVNSIWMIAEKIATMTTRKDARQVVWYPEHVQCGDRRRRPISAYDNTLWVDFEFMKVPIPEGYDTILKASYGEDYMIPKRGAIGHSYPYFKNQERNILYNQRLGQLGDIF